MVPEHRKSKEMMVPPADVVSRSCNRIENGRVVPFARTII